jgi:type IV pilus assembly protein PilB
VISLAEILVLRGLMPIESLDSVGSSTASDEFLISELTGAGKVTEAQVASARAA